MNEQKERQERKIQRGRIPAPRLYGILARSKREGVILRRGPKEWVQLINWNLSNDTLEHGQWLKGRVYENRCDLSPSGKYLIYFATGQHGTRRGYVGTMVSKPPFFTALAYWKHGGHTWGGGGVFENEKTIQLNYYWDEQILADGFSVPSSIRVKPFGEQSGKGEDWPVYYHRQCRDGWIMIQEGKCHRASADMTYFWYFDPVMIFEKVNKNGFKLQQIWRWIGRQNKPHLESDYVILDPNTRIRLQLENLTWADWDQGNLVFAKNGCLYRLSCSKKGHFPPVEEQFFKLIYNFRKNSFAPLKAPPKACKW
ncbi:unnamed protein product [Commensalibacter communis]|uniref:hypothetical protein n=1 Tax=Commensalibacter communis TaxID=2972786 RepID=UPI0022FF58EF|nr:hypothetical protein [Commensalibacter communis]CAI3926893.1 unnamed protein product [Commensalibacter communis]